MSIQEYAPGDTVFAKLRGYPWWPARVENDKDIPPQVLKQKSKAKGLLYTVFFYGSRDYGFFGPESVRPFDREEVERDLKAKKYRTKELIHAIQQALNPSSFEEKEWETNRQSQKRTRKRGRSEDERTKKRSKSLSVEKDDEETVKKNEMTDMEAFKKTAEFKRVYHIRHKLQKLVYGKEPGEIPREDYVKILAIIDEIEQLTMTVELIKYTKIAKVLNCACNYCFEENEFDINQRCIQVLKKWKPLFDHHSSQPQLAIFQS
ncbi:Tudor/PWWP/MBT [Rhizopus microsporus var. microsporus]|uniref:Tudor/PWWP/MBT n=1 Tax=Rhizopus microsporus var. microsporus TaxID=86635 RepID=A0A1X0RH09_RHIZD|nr:Tudor/PWWP/MBT [Rhizopus microsporus var. microsporus]